MNGGKNGLERDDWERVKGKDGRKGWRRMIGSVSKERRGGGSWGAGAVLERDDWEHIKGKDFMFSLSFLLATLTLLFLSPFLFLFLFFSFFFCWGGFAQAPRAAPLDPAISTLEAASSKQSRYILFELWVVCFNHFLFSL